MIAIIGGGAAGLVAAISAARLGGNVTVYESSQRCGRKILATGNGRCNMTNVGAKQENYHGANPEFVQGAINQFWVRETIEFFEGLGIVCKTEDKGKVYPYSNQASAVLDVLRMHCELLDVKIVTGFDAVTVAKAKGKFVISAYNGEKAYADKVIIATGGKAAPDLGSKGAGYAILKSFGHKVSELRPSLVQMKTGGEVPKKLKGIKIDAIASMGKYSEQGEILFTDYGLSGPPIFSLSSRYNNHKEICLDLMSEYSEAQLCKMINERKLQNPYITLENFFVGMLNKRIGQVLLKEIGIAPLSRDADSLEYDEIRLCAKTIKNWKFSLSGTMSWNNAQVTKGGVLTRDFNPDTFESNLVEGLYAVGEVLDIDGDCGGYNLQWAWSSGYLSGKAAAISEVDEK